MTAAGLTQVQRDTLEADVPKAIAALAKAAEIGATNHGAYALKLFNSPTFAAPTTRPARATNRSVIRDCETCGGDRMVVFSVRTDTYNGRSAEVEEYAPCPDCNAGCNTSRMNFRSPDPARVRERLTR